MSSGQQGSGSGNQQQTTATWTEPPWSGWIETTGDALLILEAARRGLIPRVTRRLVDAERKMITSGSVFVFDEDESGIKRWTDGFFWSPSRILGNFLLYRETDKRGSGHRGGRSSGTADDVNEQSYNVDGAKLEGQTLSRPKNESGQLGIDRARERTLVGSLTNSYKFKPDGLMKKTFSLTIGGVAQHLISYYKIEDVENGRLRSPSSLPELASLDISPEYLDKTHFRNPPKVEIGIDGLPRYRGEADDIDTSPSILSTPLSAGLPLLTDGRIAEGTSTSANNKRGKRYDPYSTPPAQKRSRKQAKTSTSASSVSPTDEQPQQSPAAAQVPGAAPQQLPPPSTGYSDPNLATVPHPAYAPYTVPNYYQLPGYPIPPPHVYSTNVYAGPSQLPPSAAVPTSAPSGAPYVYPTPSFTAPPTGTDPNQPTYYPYYPPHAPYPSYSGVAWSHYAGYPPQPTTQHAMITATDPQQKSSTDVQEVEPEIKENEEA